MKKSMTKLTGANRVLDLAALGVIVLTALYLLCAFPTLPAELPRHVDAGGNVTYDDKGVVWALVGAQAVMYAMFALFARIPAIYQNPNIPWQVKSSAKKDLAYYTRMLLGICNVEVCAMFGIMAVFATLDRPKGISATATVMLVIIIASMIPVFIKMYKVSKKEPWEL